MLNVIFMYCTYNIVFQLYMYYIHGKRIELIHLTNLQDNSHSSVGHILKCTSELQAPFSQVRFHVASFTLLCNISLTVTISMACIYGSSCLEIYSINTSCIDASSLEK